jgi:hypothetical protein
MKFFEKSDKLIQTECDKPSDMLSAALKKFKIIFYIMIIICLVITLLFAVIFIKWNLLLFKKYETKIEQVRIFILTI